MIIIPQLHPGQLRLQAYSYQEREFDIIRNYFNVKDYIYLMERIRNDYFDRLGYAFILNGEGIIARFQKELSIRFEGSPQKTFTSFSTGEGQSFHCIRIQAKPGENGCEDINAEDNSSAFIKCALVANKNRWFGADAKSGRCSD
jgi:hypothetical protein